MGEKTPARNQQSRMTAKDRNRAELVSYLSNPENDWPSRREYSTKILGYKDTSQLYHTMAPDEIDSIEAEAMENRKKRSARQRSVLYRSLYDEGKGGNVQAIKEFLDRTEGKVPDKVDATVNGGVKIVVTHRGIE